MRAALEVLLENLRALKREGATDVFAEEASLERLRAAVAKFAAASPPADFGEKKRAENSAVPARKPVPRERAVERSVASDEPFPQNPFSEFRAAEKKKPPSPAVAETEKEKSVPAFDASISAARAASVPATGTNAERLALLREQVLGDPVCNAHLHKGKRLVFGEGDPEAKIFFCGEAPGAEEETQGLPFVGPAGQLLTKMIAAAGLSREQVYIGNIMKWRPELPTLYGNRPPTPEEMAYCLPYLEVQTDILRPTVIVALGLTAVNGLLGFDPDRRIGAMRGRTLEFRGVPVVATYHPSYLLRNDSLRSKRAAWEDFLRMMEIASLPISDRQRNFFLPKKPA